MATRSSRTGARPGQHRANGHRPATKPSPQDSVSSFFQAVDEQADVVYTAFASANDRAHRLSQATLDDIQATQSDLLRLARRWAEAPFDLLTWYTCVVETAVNARGRAAQSFARWRQELDEARGETQETLRRSVQANWQAGQAGFGAARDLLRRSDGSAQ